MKRFFALFALCALVFLAACAPSSTPGPDPEPDPGTGGTQETYDPEIELTWESTRNALSVTDAYGRYFGPIDGYDDEKDVGLFYFLWTGSADEREVWDSSKLDEDTLKNDRSTVGDFHYWSEPLYGYYHAGDPWVIRRHMELFALAGVDYLVFDTSNGYVYEDVCLNLFEVALELQEQGWEVPKLIFYCHNRTKDTVTSIYNQFYDPDTEAGKRYASLWYTDGDWENRNAGNKPWILVKNNGTGSGDQGVEQNFDACSEEIRSFFYTRELQWNSEENGEYLFPSDIDDPIVHEGMISVSTAQHTSGAFSDSLFETGGKDVNRGRGWSDSDNTNSELRVDAGSNFEEEFAYAFSFGDEVDNLFLTSWNEWVAQKQPFGANSRSSCYFVDQFNPEFSRDIEMVSGLWGDAYYLQMMRNIRTFKAESGAETAAAPLSKTIVMGGSLRQWEGTVGYLDMEGDTADRNYRSAAATAGGNVPVTTYTNTTGRNDIVRTRVTYDSESVYFLVECAENITIPAAGDKGWMNILIEVEGLSGSAWENYQFVVNRTVTGSGSTLERFAADGSSEKVADVQFSLSGTALMVRVPRAALGVAEGDFTLYFKVADNVTNYTDIMDYYVDGDSAPLGRLNYTFRANSTENG